MNNKDAVSMLTSRGGTGIPGRLIRGGGAILRLCSPQYICSSSTLLQYKSSSYRLQEEERIRMPFVKNNFFQQREAHALSAINNTSDL